MSSTGRIARRDTTAELTLRGTVVNEAEDLIHCDVNLVVGVPHFVHTNFLAPIAVGQIIRTIGTAVAPAEFKGQIMSRSSIASNSILAKQFESLRDGDRYFYENADPPALVNQLNNTTLAQIIERNTDITNLQPNVFIFYSNIQGNVQAGPTGGAANPTTPGHNQPAPPPAPPVDWRTQPTRPRGALRGHGTAAPP